MADYKEQSARVRDSIIHRLIGTTLTKEDALKITEFINQCVVPETLSKDIERLG